MRRRTIFLVTMMMLLVLSRSIAEDNAEVEIGGCKIEVIFSPVLTEPLRNLVLGWVTSSARAIVAYYGQFPVSHLRIQLWFFDGHGVRGGRTRGWSGPEISIAVGKSSGSSDFREDWVLTHEMVHLGFPSVPERHYWIEEGSATYIEPIARARVGDLSPEKVWGDLVDGLPKGLPQSDDRGLDFTPTWGRTYWGGALFCLLADIEIRKRTKNQKGLEHASRAIVAAGGTIESEWPLKRAIEVGDRATGVPVLHELYDKMKDTAGAVDLVALWKQLGVVSQHGKITFDDNAPLAAIRTAITQPQAR